MLISRYRMDHVFTMRFAMRQSARAGENHIASVARARPLLLLFLLAGTACAKDAPARDPDSSAAMATASTGAAATGATASVPAEDGQWTMVAKDFANTRYSGLDEITTQNAQQLRVAWTFSTGVLRGHEAAPLVIGGTMYVVTPFPNILYALDVRDGSTKWSYRPAPASAAQGVACCDVVNRGAAYADGKIIYNTLDNHTVAVDAENGRPLWSTKVGDINRGETMTMAPLAVNGRVMVGNSGGEMGVRGWLAALDVRSGDLLWRAYATGPDSEVLIGDDFRPFYADDRRPNLGVESWPGDAWMMGGGNSWGFVSYDPDLDLIYYGTANPGPWNPEQRPGDNKWTAAVFARRPSDGRAAWAYQYNPHDQHDYDGINEHILLELPWQGSRRRVLFHPDRNGYVYLIDRLSGEVLSAEPFVHINSSHGIDLRTGRPRVAHEKSPVLGKVIRDICPAAPGGKDWQPAAFSPRTGLVYIPHQNLCMDVESLEANYISGTPYVGMNVRMKAGPGGHRGELTAWDPVSAKPAWKLVERFPVWSGALVTAGDVVFYGTMEGYFKAVDARSGAPLWQFKTGSGIIGQPVTYRGPDGKQYVAVLAGVGGWAGAIVAGDLDARDSTAGLGFAHAMQDLPAVTSKGGTLYVFSLP
jgi:PQQ-dependent dehydrogenase (methanol/ethanol family)